MIDKLWVIIVDGAVVEGPYLIAEEAIAAAQAVKRGGTLAETSSELPWPNLTNMPDQPPTERYVLVDGVVTVEVIP